MILIWRSCARPAKALDDFGIAYEIDVTSAHRSPDRTADFARNAAERGIRVIIAGAGGAAHLAGVIAAHTTLPVIGVPDPLDFAEWNGFPARHGADAGRGFQSRPSPSASREQPTRAFSPRRCSVCPTREIAKKLHAHKEKLARGVEEKSKKLKKL